MAKKLKRFYKKKYNAIKFEKKVLKKIFIKSEKDLVLSIYEKKDNEYLLKPIDDEKKIKKLNALVSHIKKNSGALGIGKLGVAVVLVSFFIIFFAFLLNPLAHKGMKMGFEKIFGGETTITGFNLNIFKGYIKYKTLQVADKNNLDKNLFQTGRAAIDLNMWEILKGKFSVEEIALEDFAIGEKRKTRAKPLPVSKKEPVQKDESSKSIDPKDAIVSALPDNLIPDRETVKKVLADNYSKLTTPVIIEENINSITSGTDKIKSNTEKLEKDIASFSKEVNEISKTKITNPSDVAGAKKLADRINSANNTLNSINTGLNSSKNEIAALEKIASQSNKNIQNSISKDINFVVSFFPLKDGFSFSALAEPMIKEQLQPFMEKYGDAFTIVMSIIESGKKDDDAKEGKKKAEPVKRGRDVKFKVFGTPSLHIEKISGSFFTGKERQALKINDITNDQEVLGRPLVFLIDSNIEGISTDIDGLFDTRKAAKDFSNINLSVMGSSFSNASFLSAIGIEKFGAGVDIKGISIISPNKDYRGSAGITLKNLKMEAANNTGKVIKNIIDKEKIIFDATYKYANNKFSLTLKSNIDKLIASAISPEKIAAEIRSFAQEEISALIKEKAAMLSDTEKQVNNLKAQINDYENQLKARKKELDDSLKGIPTPGIPGTTPSIPNITPTVPTPKSPIRL
ncbi:MAG: hypothetical protein FWE72_00970 [Spirochaetaceae bacterium]|nr:hypothetical protein [Spirochaetaceae bacterium]